VSPRRIIAASPNEPSGGSWLLNCFLELDIRVCHKPLVENVWRSLRGRVDPSYMWVDSGGVQTIRSPADVFQKWMPAFARRTEFGLREDVEILYVQDLAERVQAGHDAVFFLRDPRDALYSAWRRLTPDLSFDEFLDFPHPLTLLDRPDHWCAMVQSWQRLGGVSSFRFEDYKQDAHGLLTRILRTLRIDATEAAIAHAVAESDFAKAKAAEDRYREKHPADRSVANRAGKVGDWQTRPELAPAIERIERRAGAVMEAFGYTGAHTGGPGPAFEHHAALERLSWFARTTIAAAAAPDRTERECSIASVLEFARRVDEPLLRASRLTPDWVRTLLDSLVEFVQRDDPATSVRLATLRKAFEDGSDYHFEHLRKLMAERRSRPR
jgi:hypothetical protein